MLKELINWAASLRLITRSLFRHLIINNTLNKIIVCPLRFFFYTTNIKNKTTVYLIFYELIFLNRFYKFSVQVLLSFFYETENQIPYQNLQQ